jgi:hypothetical protein
MVYSIQLSVLMFVCYLWQVGCLSVSCGMLVVFSVTFGRSVVCQLLVACWWFVSYFRRVGGLSVTSDVSVVCQLLLTCRWFVSILPTCRWFVSYFWRVGGLSATSDVSVVCPLPAAGRCISVGFPALTNKTRYNWIIVETVLRWTMYTWTLIFHVL